MGKVIAAITTSVDGYIVGPKDGPEHGLGIGGERLHYWVMGGPWTYADDGHDTDGMHGRIRAGYRPRGAWHLELAVRHPRAVRRQAGRAEYAALTTARLRHDATPKEDPSTGEAISWNRRELT
jgi:hypothetical protein